jgi:NRAMP (natural resistance-associated macrophage protein)-like metal ion transporter
MAEYQIGRSTRTMLNGSLHKIRDYVREIGPGLITGASDDDPSCLGTLAQTGAAFGYLHLWVPLLAYPLMGVIQEICSRIGLETGRGLAENIRLFFPKPILYLSIALVCVANTITLGADLGAMAAAAQLVLGIPFIAGLVAIPALSIGLQVLCTYERCVQVLRLLALSLVGYVIVVFIIPQDWSRIAVDTFVPTLQPNRDFVMSIVALFGSAISPYLFFWQTSLVVEKKMHQGGVQEKVEKGVVVTVASQGTSRQNVRHMRLDVLTGMLFSGLVAWSVIVTMAGTAHRAGVLRVESAATAAEALRPLAGPLAYLLFATAIIGIGLLALPVLAGSVAYAVAETFHLRAGLSHKLLEAPGFYGVIIVSTLIGTAINLSGVNPMQALYYAAVVNGIAAPLLLVVVMRVGSSRAIMKDRANSRLSNVLGWGTALIMAAAALTLFVFTVFGR